MTGQRLATTAFVLLFAAAPLAAGAAGMEHGSMSGMHGGAAAGHGGATAMGDKVFAGRVGPWQAEARLMDMKAHMEKAMAGGMKMQGEMKNSHHIAITLSDPATKAAVVEGKGT